MNDQWRGQCQQGVKSGMHFVRSGTNELEIRKMGKLCLGKGCFTKENAKLNSFSNGI